jgi:hypothetical protein
MLLFPLTYHILNPYNISPNSQTKMYFHKVIDYDSTQNFQTGQATCTPWVENLVSREGFIHTMKCKIYSLIEKTMKIIGYKWDPLIKHHNNQNVMWDMPKLRVKNGGEYIAMHTWRTWNYMFIGILSLFWFK